MSRLQEFPLRRRLTVLILASTASALLLACGLLAGYQWQEFRGALVREMGPLADMLAANTQAALSFQDAAAAEANLGALQAEPKVARAAIYGKDGARFAGYSRDGRTEPPKAPAADGYRFGPRGVELFRPVMLNGKRIGTIYLDADLAEVYRRLRIFAGIGVLVLVGSLLFALVVSAWLQRPISRPLLELAETAGGIAERKDFGVRVSADGWREIRTLKDAFNRMLDGIQESERALSTANASLRQEVAERRGAEERIRAQVARLEMLNRITRAIGERQDIRSIFQVVIRMVEEHLPVDFCCVGLLDEAAGTIRIESVGVHHEALGMAVTADANRTLVPDANGLVPCLQGRLVYDAELRGLDFPFPRRLAAGGLRAMVAAPLLVESKVFGIFFAARTSPESFSSGECEFLTQLSGHVALAANQGQLYAALQQAYEDLRQTQQAVMQQERLRALGQMASGIAHDINNAISPVALYTESLLENEPNLSARARDYLGTIQHAIDDVAQTVARMREFYRQRESQLQLTPLQVNPLIQQVLELSRARWSDMPQQRGITIKVATELAPDLPPVLGIESEIREALVNLLFNGVDAMPSGGTITLRTRLQGSGAASAVAVEVADTGIGMDEDTRRRCLEPFFTTKGDRGTGLGLAMVYGTVRRHGAEIEIDSAKGQGTVMRLLFPVPAQAAVATAAPEAPVRVPKRLRLLVIDDDPLLIKSLRDTLETDGHQVVAANGGQAGIEAFTSAQARGEPFIAVITDLGMPYVDGRKVASEIKAASPQTPVIMLTGWGQRLVTEGDIPPHVDRVLNKPPKLRELREALAQCLAPSAPS
ncbi:MAG TPA: ATP-binding protein [Opitutaceae bacterium]|nr:ATP-binding protein [Opitutaceae bacterium]